MKPISAILILLTLAFNAISFPNLSAPDVNGSMYKLKTVVLDAGHGGHDNGCKGASAYEKHIALSIVLKLGKYIETNMPDVKVIYTRKKDVFVELNERAAIANRNKADLFISVHCNAAKSSSAYGTETWVMGQHKTDANLDVAKRENAVIMLEDDYKNKYEYDPNSPVSHIIFSVYQNAYVDQSIALAKMIEEQFTTRAGRTSRGVKQAGFVVLYKTAMPSVLVESGFLSNNNEEIFLRSDQGQDLIASGIYRAFRQYKETLEDDQKPEEVVQIQVQKNTSGKEEIKEASKQPVKQPEKQSENTKGEVAENKPQQKEPAITKENTPKVNENIIPQDKAPAPKPKDEAIEFRIQFLATKNKIDPKKPPYSNINNIHSEDIGNGILRYFSGSFSNPDEARADLAKIKQAGFKDAFLVAYRNGIRLQIDDVLTQFE